MESKIIFTLVKCLLFASIIGGVYFYGEHRGVILERSSWQAKEITRKDAETQAVATRINENEAERLKLINDGKVALNEKDNELKAVHAMYDGYVPGSLRINKDRVCGKGSSSQTTSNANGTGSIDAASTDTIALPDEIERDLRQLAREADEVTANYRALQEFIRKQQEVQPVIQP